MSGVGVLPAPAVAAASTRPVGRGRDAAGPDGPAFDDVLQGEVRDGAHDGVRDRESVRDRGEARDRDVVRDRDDVRAAGAARDEGATTSTDGRPDASAGTPSSEAETAAAAATTAEVPSATVLAGMTPTWFAAAVAPEATVPPADAGTALPGEPGATAPATTVPVTTPAAPTLATSTAAPVVTGAPAPTTVADDATATPAGGDRPATDTASATAPATAPQATASSAASPSTPAAGAPTADRPLVPVAPVAPVASADAVAALSGAGMPVAAVAAPAPAAPTAPAPPAAPVPAPADVPLAEQLGARLTSLRGLGEGRHVLSLTVTPETFGPVRVVAHIAPDAVRIELVGATDQAREALRGALGDLRRDLAAAGLQADLDLGARADQGLGRESAASDPETTGRDGVRTTGTGPSAAPDRTVPTTVGHDGRLDLVV